MTTNAPGLVPNPVHNAGVMHDVTRPRAAPRAFYFGTPGLQAFGFFHPAECSPTGHALLICPSFGTEDVNAHASLRRLAEAAADCGIPALRLTYPGCGDAEGDADTPDLFQAWQHSIVEAVASLRSLSGATHISLLGLRLGALLAALAAPRCGALHDFIAVAPVVSGRAYVREMKALHMAGFGAQQTAAPHDGPPVFESGGFVMAEATHQALSSVDLLKLDGLPAARLLLIERDDLPGPAAKWAARLAERGASVEQQMLSGYAAMMADPHWSATPATLAPMVLARLLGEKPYGAASSRPDQRSADATNQAPSRARLDASPALPPHSAVMQARSQAEYAVREQPVLIGTDPSLFGILSRRDAAGADFPASDLGVLMLNAGATRHIGPNRLYVPLARHWAEQGHATLRIDIGGLGESPAPSGKPDNIVYSATAMGDVARALAWLHTQPGVTRVVLLGLCSGAYHALKAVVQELPVDAAIMINPLTFFWHEGMSLDPDAVTDARVMEDMMRHRQSIWQLGIWAKLLRGGVPMRRFIQIARQTVAWRCDNLYRRLARPLGLPLKDDLHGELTRIGQREVPLRFIFSDTDPGLPMLRAQGGGAVGKLQSRGLLHIRTIAHADHTFTLAASRRELEQVLKDTMDELAKPKPAQ
jgi:alpha-beta hydrolase superfamily lysophospholipase